MNTQDTMPLFNQGEVVFPEGTPGRRIYDYYTKIRTATPTTGTMLTLLSLSVAAGNWVESPMYGPPNIYMLGLGYPSSGKTLAHQWLDHIVRKHAGLCSSPIFDNFLMLKELKDNDGRGLYYSDDDWGYLRKSSNRRARPLNCFMTTLGGCNFYSGSYSERQEVTIYSCSPTLFTVCNGRSIARDMQMNKVDERVNRFLMFPLNIETRCHVDWSLQKQEGEAHAIGDFLISIGNRFSAKTQTLMSAEACDVFNEYVAPRWVTGRQSVPPEVEAQYWILDCYLHKLTTLLFLADGNGPEDKITADIAKRTCLLLQYFLDTSKAVYQLKDSSDK